MTFFRLLIHLQTAIPIYIYQSNNYTIDSTTYIDWFVVIVKVETSQQLYIYTFISSERLICKIISSFFSLVLVQINRIKVTNTFFFPRLAFGVCRQRLCKQHRHCNSTNTYCINQQSAAVFDWITLTRHTHIQRCVIESINSWYIYRTENTNHGPWTNYWRVRFHW